MVLVVFAVAVLPVLVVFRGGGGGGAGAGGSVWQSCGLMWGLTPGLSYLFSFVGLCGVWPLSSSIMWLWLVVMLVAVVGVVVGGLSLAFVFFASRCCGFS